MNRRMRRRALSLDTLAKRKATKREKIRIRSSLHPDGRDYDLRNRDDLSVAELRMIERRGKRARKLLEGMTEADARVLLQLTDETVTVLLPSLEREVLRELDPLQKAAIFDVWSKLTRGES